LAVATNEVAVFYYKITNVGNDNDTIVITGEAGGGDFSVKYFDSKSGGNEITGQVTGSGYSYTLAPGVSAEGRVEIRYFGNNLATKEVTITGKSQTDPTQVGTIRATATFVPLTPPIDHFDVVASSTAIAGVSFSTTIIAKKQDGTTCEVGGTANLLVDQGLITPESINLTAGVWTGSVALSAVGRRTITVRSGAASGSAVVLVFNATMEFTAEDLGVSGMNIKIPAGAATQEVTVSVEVVSSPGDPPAGYKIGSKVYNIEGSPSAFLIPITITIPLTERLSDPRVYYWNGTSWVRDGIVVISYTDTSITFTTTHFAPFAAMGALPSNLVRFGPNPFNPNGGSGRFWYWLDEDKGTSIYLIDLSGAIVWKKSFSAGENGGRKGENNIEFDGKTAWGDVLGDGVYVYKVAQDGRSIGGGKIAVIKR